VFSAQAMPMAAHETMECELVSIISGTDAAIYTAVVVAQCNSR
jgi:hypothetical protein